MKLHILHDWSKWEQIGIKDYLNKYNKDIEQIEVLKKHCLICNKTKYNRVKI